MFVLFNVRVSKINPAPCMLCIAMYLYRKWEEKSRRRYKNRKKNGFEREIISFAQRTSTREIIQKESKVRRWGKTEINFLRRGEKIIKCVHVLAVLLSSLREHFTKCLTVCWYQSLYGRAAERERIKITRSRNGICKTTFQAWTN